MAFVTETFGNFNSRSSYAARSKKSFSIRPGTLATGVAVAAFAWVAATLITTQSMVLSLPGAATSTDSFLAPRASAFIVPQNHAMRTAHFASQTTSLHGQSRFGSVAEAEVQTKAGGADAVRVQLAYALAQQTSDMKQAQDAAASIKSGRLEVAAAPPERVDRLRKVIAINFATAVQSLAQAKYAAALMPAAGPLRTTGQPAALASAAPEVSLPAIAEARPLPAKDADIAVAEAVLNVIPVARPARETPVQRASATSAIARATGSDAATQPPSRVMAYADPDDSSVRKAKPFLNPFAAISPGAGTAIYDIEAKTVYLPSGERLEAHSGLGHMRDNPRYVDRKNTGPTPPETYNLTYRESLFHGVQALRLTPANGARVYGRDGLLAHTYMLRGARGESNGCVVFKDYNRFLAAFRRGEIKRLKVVTRVSSAASVASSR
ncbi:tlde1 domain-containing protein [Rhizobium sp. NPDC090279]|uniref:tlde1 domain-containing protein n=1 Tax=Rhizobium sp. NPDC090279 TaxID=3364499 RepID=UPI00383A8EDE